MRGMRRVAWLGMKHVDDLQCCKNVELRMCWLVVAVLHVGAEARVGRGRARSLAVINLKLRVKVMHASWCFEAQLLSGAHNNAAHHECRLKSLGSRSVSPLSTNVLGIRVSLFQTWISPDKFLEAAFLVSCVALRACEAGLNLILLKNQPAQFFVFFVDVGNCFFEVAVDCIGLRENVCKGYQCEASWMFTCSSIDSARRSASTCEAWQQTWTWIEKVLKISDHFVGFLEGALVLHSSGNLRLKFLRGGYHLLFDGLKSRSEFVTTALTICFYFSLFQGNEIFMYFDVPFDLNKYMMMVRTWNGQQMMRCETYVDSPAVNCFANVDLLFFSALS